MRSGGFEEEEIFGVKTEGLAGEMAEGGDEESGEKEDDEAEGDLRGDECIHRAVSGVRFCAAFECGDGLDGGGAQGGGETEEKSDGESEEQAEGEDAPVC